MNQISEKLRRGNDRYFHWCPGCLSMHPLPDSWTFDGNLEEPSFAPSFLHTIGHNDRPTEICHYVLTKGILNFCSDCHHELANQSVPLPDIPEFLRDAEIIPFKIYKT